MLVTELAERLEPSPVLGLLSLYDTENNAVRLLAAILRQRGYRVVEIYFKDWINNYFDPPATRELELLAEVLETERVNLLGLSLRSSPYFKVAGELTRFVRGRVGIPVIWGGLHPTLEPEKCIVEADAVCRGEAERALPEFIDRLSSHGDFLATSNFWFRTPQGVVRNEIGPLLEDLDSLPFRDYTHKDKFWIHRSRLRRGDPMASDPVYQIFTTRGCPFSCSFCYNSTLKKDLFLGKGRYYRQRSVRSVIEELHYARRVFRNLKRFRFDDEVFPFDKEWVAEFAERYRTEVGMPFECFLEPTIVDEEIVRRLRSAGLEVVYMGIQNNPRVSRQLYDRDVREDDILGAARLFHSLGIDARYQVILDDPLSTTEDKEWLFRLLLSLPRPIEVYLFSMTVYPRTELARKLMAEGLMTERDIEGEAQKTFRQYRVDLSYPRPAEDRFWAALIVLVSKSFIPKGLLFWLSRRLWLRRHPLPLVAFAQVANVAKMGWVAARMVSRGEMTTTLIRRWLHLRSLITQ